MHSCPITELFSDEWVNLVFRRVSESCLTQFQVSSVTATSMREQATFGWDDDASFVLDQHADLDFDTETTVHTYTCAHYPVYEPIRLCSHLKRVCFAESGKYQFDSLWFDLTRWSKCDLVYLEYCHISVFCSMTFKQFFFYKLLSL